MDELTEAIGDIQEARDAAKEMGLSEIYVLLEDALYTLQHYFLTEKGVEI